MQRQLADDITYETSHRMFQHGVSGDRDCVCIRTVAYTPCRRLRCVGLHQAFHSPYHSCRR